MDNGEWLIGGRRCNLVGVRSIPSWNWGQSYEDYAVFANFRTTNRCSPSANSKTPSGNHGPPTGNELSLKGGFYLSIPINALRSLMSLFVRNRRKGTTLYWIDKERTLVLVTLFWELLLLLSRLQNPSLRIINETSHVCLQLRQGNTILQHSFIVILILFPTRHTTYFRTITLPLAWWVARISTSAICTCSGALAT